MVTKVERFQAKDGKLFTSEKEAMKYDLDMEFVDKMAEIQVSSFNGGDWTSTPALQRQNARKELGAWIVRNQDKLRELLIWYDLEKTQLTELFTADIKEE